MAPGMGRRGVYARHSFVQWAARGCAITAFFVCTVLYGLPLAVLLGLLASCAYCGVSYISFTLEGRQWRRALERGYDKLFTNVRGAGSFHRRRRRDNKEEEGSGIRRGQASLQCHKEAQKMTQLIMRDFVLEWYENASTELEFPDDCQKILEHVALEVNIRMQRIDLDEVIYELLAAILPYLEAVNRAGKVVFNGVEIFDVKHERCLRRFEETPSVSHRALRSLDAETRYYRQLLDAVIQSAIPDEYRNCDLACMFLRELLLHNILEPLLSLLCDPDFLNKAIPIILRKADPVAVQTVLGHIQEENEQLEHSLLRGRVIQAHRRPPSMRRFHSISEHFSQTMNSKPIPVQLSRVRDPPQLYMTSKTTEIEEVDVGEEVRVGSEDEESDSSSDKVAPCSDTEEVDGLPLSLSPSSSLGSSGSSLAREETPPLGRKGSLLSHHHSPFSSRKSSPRRRTIAKINSSRAQGKPPAVARSTLSVARGAAAVASSSSLESDSDLVYIDLAPIFATRYVHIRHGSSAYIGYVFKFPKTMLSLEDLQELGLPSNETHLESVKRYSDFTRLHQQLQKSPELQRHTQGLDLPERHGFANVVSKLPFTSKDLDPTSLLERKQGLEKYIQLVSSRPEILESALFQEFLRSGVILLRKANALNPHRSRKRTLLGIMKGQSVEEEEAKPLPKRPMESVLSSYLNTSLPLPCRKLNSATSLSSTATSKTGLPATKNGSSHRDRKPVLVKAATVEESGSGMNFTEDNEKRRTLSLSDYDERSLMGGADDNLSAESEIDCGMHKLAAAQADSCGGCHRNDVSCPTDLQNGTSDTTTISPTSPRPNKRFLTRAKNHFLRLASIIIYCIQSSITIIRQCSHPLTHHTLETLTKTQRSDNPLSDILLSLGAEVSTRHLKEVWVMDKSSQLAILTLFGGAIDRYLMQELHTVLEKEQNWMRALYHLRHTLWVGGSKELDRSSKEKLTDKEREDRKKEAINAFKKFLPNLLPYIVGSEDYNHAVTHCLECLQNPRINRHVFLRVIDVLLPKLVPELHSEDFQKRLTRLRTLTSTHAHKVPHSRPLSKKH